MEAIDALHKQADKAWRKIENVENELWTINMAADEILARKNPELEPIQSEIDYALENDLPVDELY